MENKVYKLRYLPLFVSDMEEMLDYFMFNFKNPDAASHFLDQVETAIRKRLNYPEAFEPYDGRAMVGKYPYYRIYWISNKDGFGLLCMMHDRLFL